MSVIWNSRVPSKVSFFAWEASLGKVLIIDQLQKRGWSLVNRCFKDMEESKDHILLRYAKVRVLWQLLFALFGSHYVQATTIKDSLLGWYGLFVGKRHKKILTTAPFVYLLDCMDRKESKVIF